MTYTETPRHSVVAGRFYPDDPQTLRADVSRYLHLRPKKLVDLSEKEIFGLLMPHAGYVFSGAVAGMTLGAIAVPDRVILLGPNHTGMGLPLSVWNGGPWKTPLGPMPVDRETVEALIGANVGFTGDLRAHLQEHALEVLVPFLQIKNPKAKITAITVGGAPFAVLRKAGEALAEVIAASSASGERTLLIVSSDMSHYVPHETAVKMDTLALNAIKTLDPETYFAAIRDNDISMCGVFPMTMALFALRKLGASSARVLAYATSGQTGRAYGADMDRVVGYAGAVIVR